MELFGGDSGPIVALDSKKNISYKRENKNIAFKFITKFMDFKLRMLGIKRSLYNMK